MAKVAFVIEEQLTEFKQWCLDNCKGLWMVSRDEFTYVANITNIYFMDPDDTVHAMLRWSNVVQFKDWDPREASCSS